tara:strand:- start:184 stop:423 length:240 start_codon:yes stop_codon:yes gene_type:complete
VDDGQTNIKMKKYSNLFLSLAVPFLLILATFGIIQRESRDKVETFPAFVVGSGLILFRGLRRIKRRKMLLRELRNTEKN